MEPDIIEETQFSVIETENETEIAHINNDVNRLKFYAQKLKLAVALAVIRSAPPEMTPEKYATYLIENIKDNSNKWKNKCEVLEKELVALTQKLETITMKEKFNMPDMDITRKNFTKLVPTLMLSSFYVFQLINSFTESIARCKR